MHSTCFKAAVLRDQRNSMKIMMIALGVNNSGQLSAQHINSFAPMEDIL